MRLSVEGTGGQQVPVINRSVDGQSVSYSDRGFCISGVPRASPQLILQHSPKIVSKEALKPVLQEAGVSKKRWWYSQLQHYGLESTHNVGIAKDRFFKAGCTSEGLSVPYSLSQAETDMAKAWQEAEAVLKRSRLGHGIRPKIGHPGVRVAEQQLCHAHDENNSRVLHGVTEERLNQRRSQPHKRNASNADILEVGTTKRRRPNDNSDEENANEDLSGVSGSDLSGLQEVPSTQLSPVSIQGKVECSAAATEQLSANHDFGHTEPQTQLPEGRLRTTTSSKTSMELSEVVESPQTADDKHDVDGVLSEQATLALDAIRGLCPSAAANLVPVICGNGVKSTRFAGERLMRYLRNLLDALHTRRDSSTSLSMDSAYDDAIVVVEKCYWGINKTVSLVETVEMVRESRPSKRRKKDDGVITHPSDCAFAFSDQLLFRGVKRGWYSLRLLLETPLKRLTRWDPMDQSLLYYYAQLRFYGLPPTRHKAIAKLRLWHAMQDPKFKRPRAIKELELELKAVRENPSLDESTLQDDVSDEDVCSESEDEHASLDPEGGQIRNWMIECPPAVHQNVRSYDTIMDVWMDIRSPYPVPVVVSHTCQRLRHTCRPVRTVFDSDDDEDKMDEDELYDDESETECAACAEAEECARCDADGPSGICPGVDDCYGCVECEDERPVQMGEVVDGERGYYRKTRNGKTQWVPKRKWNSIDEYFLEQHQQTREYERQKELDAEKADRLLSQRIVSWIGLHKRRSYDESLAYWSSLPRKELTRDRTLRLEDLVGVYDLYTSDRFSSQKGRTKDELLLTSDGERLWGHLRSYPLSGRNRALREMARTGWRPDEDILAGDKEGMTFLGGGLIHLSPMFVEAALGYSYHMFGVLRKDGDATLTNSATLKSAWTEIHDKFCSENKSRGQHSDEYCFHQKDVWKMYSNRFSAYGSCQASDEKEWEEGVIDAAIDGLYWERRKTPSPPPSPRWSYGGCLSGYNSD